VTLSLYIHYPFCLSKCPYCDFNSHVSEVVDHDLWTKSTLKELEHFYEFTAGQTIHSIFFGGGTPSLMPVSMVEQILQKTNDLWGFEENCEVTLEANPTSVEAQKFSDLSRIGVNRLSLGIQSLDQKQLEFLGRTHDTIQARQAIETAQKYFRRMSFDLIYARPNQTVGAWKAELDLALQLSAGHLSLYQLTIEKGTPFFTRHARHEFHLPNDDLASDLYDATTELCATYGLYNYEVSNYARVGEESRHNLCYWNYQDYIGCGPGAHGRLTIKGQKTATRMHRAPEIWLQRVAEQGLGTAEWQAISAQQEFEERLMMGLRLKTGIDVSVFQHPSLSDHWQKCLNSGAMKTLRAENILILTEDRLFASQAGRKTLDSVLNYLLNSDRHSLRVASPA
jgi:putative oxygen-independent coproporphyrinogen III oxidase